jgi:exopolyphosphatase / guanosine-5'-triphosphate,3'-diphosphate pyrophosphatase
MRIAIIDLGTNTFNLLVAELNASGKAQIIHSSVIPVMLGKGCFNNNYLTPVAIKRGIEAIGEQLIIAKNYSVSKTFAFGTSALRNATNKNVFIDEVRTAYHLDVKVINGDREAELIYKGVKLALNLGNSIALIMDIGGGSTEFIISDEKTIYWKKSFEIGAARILEKFTPSDPITADELNQIETYLEAELKDLFNALKDYPAETLIGSSGSFDTFAEMIAHDKYNPDLIVGKTEYSFELVDYFATHNQIIKSSRNERLNTPGLTNMRVDMIVIASILVNHVLQKSGISKMRLSTYSLKEGVLNELLKTNLIPVSGY